jgi:hypothetical protein
MILHLLRARGLTATCFFLLTAEASPKENVATRRAAPWPAEVEKRVVTGVPSPCA